MLRRMSVEQILLSDLKMFFLRRSFACGEAAAHTERGRRRRAVCACSVRIQRAHPAALYLHVIHHI